MLQSPSLGRYPSQERAVQDAQTRLGSLPRVSDPKSAALGSQCQFNMCVLLPLDPPARGEPTGSARVGKPVDRRAKLNKTPQMEKQEPSPRGQAARLKYKRKFQVRAAGCRWRTGWPAGSLLQQRWLQGTRGIRASWCPQVIFFFLA